MKPGKYDAITKLLIKRKALLLKTDQRIKLELNSAAGNASGDEADLAEAEHEREMAFLLKNRGAGEVRLIDEALERISSGKYGICAECGDKIHGKRLAIQPYSILCVECQEEEERIGKVQVGR